MIMKEFSYCQVPAGRALFPERSLRKLLVPNQLNSCTMSKKMQSTLLFGSGLSGLGTYAAISNYLRYSYSSKLHQSIGVL